MEVRYVLKWIIQIVFILIGGTLGLLFLPNLYDFINLSEIPLLQNAYVSVLIGAVLLYVVALFLTDYVIHFIKWMEERLLIGADWRSTIWDAWFSYWVNHCIFPWIRN